MSQTPNNSSQIYVLRAADNDASASEQESGGFLSASFYMNAAKGSGTSSAASSTTSAASRSVTPLSSPTQQSASSPSSSPTSSGGLSAGASAGIGVGVAFIAIAVAAVGWLAFKRHQRRQPPPPESSHLNTYYMQPTEVDGTQTHQKPPLVEAPANERYPQELPSFRD
jgi:hypothetical protein